jgi:hypothetical protein
MAAEARRMLLTVKPVPGYGAGGFFSAARRRVGGRGEQFGGPQALQAAVGPGECLLQGWFRVDLADAGEVAVIFEFEDGRAWAGALADALGDVVGVGAQKRGLGLAVTVGAVDASSEAASVFEDDPQVEVASKGDNGRVGGVGDGGELVMVFKGG